MYQTKEGYEWKGKKIYDPRPLIKDKDNNVVDQGIAKAIYGKIDGDKFVITGDGYISKGEYIKTKDKIPSDEELKYTYNKMLREMTNQEYKTECKKIRDNTPK